MGKARFITLEGGEASGKSSNLSLLQAWFLEKNIPHVITHEPGGTPLAESIRRLLLTETPEKMAPDTELLLIFASRAQHISEVIRPALEAGKWVVCSRFTDSSYAYQGGGRGLSKHKILALETLVQGDLQPDLTFLLDVPLDLAFNRIQERPHLDRIETESRAFFERVRQAFLDRAASHPQRFCVIDASQNLETIQAIMLGRLAHFCS